MPTLKAKIGGAWVPIAGPGSGADEVFVGASDPGAAYELWYDTDDPGAGLSRPWNTAWGVLNYKTKTSHTTITGGTDVFVLITDSITIPANRLLRVSAQAGLYNSTAAENLSFNFQIKRGTFNTGIHIVNFGVGSLKPTGSYGDSCSGCCEAIEQLAAGTYTWYIAGSGTSNGLVTGSATSPVTLTVADVGPVPGSVP